MSRTTFSLVSVALIAVVLAAVPSYADTITVNTATRAFLDAWIKAIPNLQAIWLNPVICARSGIICNAADNSLSIRMDGVTSTGFNFIGTLPEVPTNINGANVQVTAVSVKGKTRFTGTVPASWARLTRLQWLDFSQTKLSGAIPDSLNALSNLASADFSNSYFCYGMPNWNASGMPLLALAKFNNNNLHGTFASSWSDFSAALSLDLTGNQLCGCMPSSWTSTNLVAAAAAMGSAAVNGCTRQCTMADLTYCPAPNPSGGNAASGRVATFAAASFAIFVAAVALAA